MTPPPQLERYVQRILHAYLDLPDTPRRPRAQDRCLAAQLHLRGLSEVIVEAAFQLATLRRIDRPPGAIPLTPIRSLHYFLPVIDELIESHASPAYLKYVRERFAKIVRHRPPNDGSKKIVFT